MVMFVMQPDKIFPLRRPELRISREQSLVDSGSRVSHTAQRAWGDAQLYFFGTGGEN